MKYDAWRVTVMPDVTYKAPSGRPCRLEHPIHFSADIAHFVYTDEIPVFGRYNTPDGFRLARDNWHLLRAWP